MVIKLIKMENILVFLIIKKNMMHFQPKFLPIAQLPNNFHISL